MFATSRVNEEESLVALRALKILDTAPEKEFDAIVRVAGTICGTPISLISLIDADRQWFKANVGLPGVPETPREVAFCAHTVLGDAVVVVPDAQLDERFKDNPLVTSSPDIRFYAAAPLVLASGVRVGTLCVIDSQPRSLSEGQRTALSDLASVVVGLLDGRVARQDATQILEDVAIRQFYMNIVVNNLPNMLAYWDRDLNCRFVNQAYQRWFGVKPEEVLGTHVSRLLGPEIYALNKHHMEQALKGIPQQFERIIPNPEGGVRQSMANYVPDIVGGEVFGFLSQVIDVTHLKNVESALRKSQEFLERTGALAGVGGWELDIAASALFWSDAVCRIHGYPPGFQPTLEQALAAYTAASRNAIETAVQAAIESGTDFDLELEITRTDGSIRSVRALGSAEFQDGKPVRLSGAFQDVTERARLVAEISEKSELLRITMQSIGDAVITTDAAGRVTWLNPVAELMTGWLKEEAVNRPLQEIFHIISEQTREPAVNPVAACLEFREVVGLANHTVLISRDGKEYGIEDSAAPIRNNDGEVLGAVMVFHDVSEQRRLSWEMSHRATHDALTGLINRSEFETRLSRALLNVHDTDARHALLFIDLDQFKLVNDACGHAAGDQLLRQVSRLMADLLRERDSIARLGGDEFAIILEYCSAENAMQVAQKICNLMENFRFFHEEKRFRVGASIGLVPIHPAWADIEAIQQAADRCCYAAKEAGRNRVHLWFDSDIAMQDRRSQMQWTSRIEQALDTDGFCLFAQRVASQKPSPTGTSPGIRAEVLLRMKNDDGSLTQPGLFLPAAERFHLASRIDRWVLRHAIDWMRALPSLDLIACLNVNLSGQSVGDREFHGWAKELFAEAGPALCAKLCLEITETAVVTNLSDASIFIRDVQAAMITVALDDFGAGASSFGYLRVLPVDSLKIDGRFIQGVIKDPLDQAAVRCFIDVAKIMGIPTVAEFVEDPDILDRLTEMGIDYAQGFLVHRPELIDALLT